jgi:hypothetical protein
LIGPDDLDPKMLVWGMRRQIDPAEIPAQGFVIRFDFRGIPKSNRGPRYWWQAPSRNVDVVIGADLAAFTRVWLGYAGLAAALESGKISLQGSARAITTVRRLLALQDQPKLKSFIFLAFQSSSAVAAQ